MLLFLFLFFVRVNDIARASKMLRGLSFELLKDKGIKFSGPATEEKSRGRRAQSGRLWNCSECVPDKRFGMKLKREAGQFENLSSVTTVGLCGLILILSTRF